MGLITLSPADPVVYSFDIETNSNIREMIMTYVTRSIYKMLAICSRRLWVVYT